MKLGRSFSILLILVFLFCFSSSNVYAIDISQLPSIPSVNGYNYFLIIDRLDMGYVNTLPDGKQVRYGLILFTKDRPAYVCTTSDFNDRFSNIYDVDTSYKCVFLNVDGPYKVYNLVDGEWVFQYEDNHEWFRFGGSPVVKDITPQGLFGNIKVYNLDGSVFYSPDSDEPISDEPISDEPLLDEIVSEIILLREFLTIGFGFFIGFLVAYVFLRFVFGR